MAKKDSTLTLPTIPTPSMVASSVLQTLGVVAPNAADIKAAAEEKRKADALAAFETSPIGKDKTLHAAVDAIGTEGARQAAESKTNGEKMESLVAVVYPSKEWAIWGIHSLVGGYIAAKYGEYPRTLYRAALAKRCEHLGCPFPTASANASGNADKGKSPKRKYAKAARAFDNAITAVTEFYATMLADAPSLKHWTGIMAAMRSLQVQMHADSENDKLKKTA